MQQPTIPPGSAAKLKRIIALLEAPVQLILKHRWELDGTYFLTRDQLAQRMKISVTEVRRLEIAGREDCRRLLIGEHWL